MAFRGLGRARLAAASAAARLILAFALLGRRLARAASGGVIANCRHRLAFGRLAIADAQGFDGVHRRHQAGIVMKGNRHGVAIFDFGQRLALVVEYVKRDMARHMDRDLGAAFAQAFLLDGAQDMHGGRGGGAHHAHAGACRT